jgi:hypothetical protein
LTKYTKCNVWRLVVRYDIYKYVIRRLKVKENLLAADNHEKLISQKEVAGGGGGCPWPGQQTAAK